MTTHSNGAHPNGSAQNDGPSAAEKDARRPARIRRVLAHTLVAHPLEPPERYSDANVAELVASIQELGLLEPPTIWQRPDGLRLILFGHRRTRAWQLLSMAGLVEGRIRVFVRDDLTEAEAVLLIAAEYGHQQAFSAVHTARVIGHAHRVLTAEHGKQVPVRRLAATLPWGKSSIHDYLKINAALEDPRTRDLVHSMDKEKALLVEALRQPRFQARLRALRAYQEGGASAVRAVLRPKEAQKPEGAEEGEQPQRTESGQQAVTRVDHRDGYDVTIRLRATMSADAVDEALAVVEQLAADLQNVKKLGRA